ncbi:MAG: hypothetical protein AAF638_12365 [Pseudomonadota bacterium]
MSASHVSPSVSPSASLGETLTRRFGLPAISVRNGLTVLAAGVAATIAFDVFGQYLSPALGFAKLAPVPLAQSVIRTVTGINSADLANVLHYITGLLFYPLGYILFARPAAKAVMPNLPWWITASVYGVVLWAFALYAMAHLVAGLPPFLGFSGITWVALVGHVVFALVVGAVLRLRNV